jgi:hypothetical protein
MKARSDREPAKKNRDLSRAPASPYGPQPRGVDEAAGGADSSPHETEPTRERKVRADEDRRLRRNPDPGGETNKTA